MTISVDWSTETVLIPRGEPSVSTVVTASPEVWEYDLDALRKELGAISASQEGIPFSPLHFHTAPFTIGNVQLARVVGILDGRLLEFEDGQYQVNYVGANTDFSEAINRVINQVSVTPQNSAGLITTASTIQLISSAVWETPQASHVAAATMGFVLNQITYQNKIWIDPLDTTGNAAAGQVAGINGTPTSPCLTVEDAFALGMSLNITTLRVLSDTTLDRDFIRWEFEGSRDVLINPAGYDITSGEFHGLCLVGDFGGYRIHVENSAIGDVAGSLQASGMVGEFSNCVMNAIGMQLATGNSTIAHSHSSVTGNSRPTIDFNSVVGATLSIRAYSGGMEFLNMTDASNFSTVELVAGRLTLGPTNSAGAISARGIGTLSDTSTGTAVDTAALVNKVDVTSEVWEEPISAHVTPGTMGYEVASLDYDGKIWIDVVNGSAGALININGTRSNPCNNVADSDTLRGLTGFERLHVTGTVVLTSSQVGTVWENSGASATIVLNGQDISDARFIRCGVTGDSAGSTGVLFDSCNLINVLNWQGSAVQSVLVGITSLVAGGTGVTTLAECLAGSTTPIIDVQGATLTALTVAKYTGRLEVQNLTSPGLPTSVNFDSGSLSYGATNTAGTLIITGQGQSTDTGAGVGLTVLNSSLHNASNIADTVWDEALTDHVIVGSTGEAQAAQGNVGQVVLDALLDGHFDPGSVGEALTLIKGLVQSNYMVDSTDFNSSGLMTSGRFRLFDTPAQVDAATDGASGQGEIATFSVTAETELGDPSKLKSYKVSRD